MPRFLLERRLSRKGAWGASCTAGVASVLALALFACQGQAVVDGERQAPPPSQGEARQSLPTYAHADYLGLEPAARRVELTYAATVREVPASAETAQIWIPLPAEHRHQRLLSWELVEDYPAEVVTEPEYGNRVLRIDLSPAAQRTPDEPIPVTLRAQVVRQAFSAWQVPVTVTASLPPAELASHLRPNRLVPTDGIIAEEAREVVGDAEDPLEMARRIYVHVVETLSYDKSGEGWGRGDAVYACDVRTGNCTEFHSLFMAEARSVGVPARFVIGVPLPPGESEGEIPGYHCWADFYLEGRGWVPVDASEANKHPEMREFFFGGLDAHRVEFTVGRDLDLPGAAVRGLNFFVYPHVEVDGIEHEAVDTNFSFRDMELPGVTAAF